MGLIETFVHGNALTVQNPFSVDQTNHLSSGIQLLVHPGTQNWFHIPISTPVLINGVQTQLVRVFILFQAVNGHIGNVWISDGAPTIQEFNGLFLEGEHLTAIDSVNMFAIAPAHSVRFGIGISIQFLADASIEGGGPLSTLFVATAGADFNM